MSQQPVKASWAFISKRPGAGEDFGVLEASDGHVGEFAVVYVVGVPSSRLEADAPLAPPWVTFGSHRIVDGAPVLSVSVQDPKSGKDQTGRWIWPRRFFLCDYAEVAAAGASYQTLWEATASVALPVPGSALIPLAPAAASLDQLLETIRGIGFSRVAAIAAAVLDGPVAVTNTGHLPALEPGARPSGRGPAAPGRLALLDAIAALLPYGFRAELSVSSAVDNAISHEVRLVLADYAKPPGQREEPLYGESAQRDEQVYGQPDRPLSSTAARYLAALEAKAALGDAEGGDGLASVVAHLWQANDVCSFDEPEEALRILGGLHWLPDKIRFALRGPQGLQTSLAFFADMSADQVSTLWQHPSLEPELRFKLLTPVLAEPYPTADDILREHWEVFKEDLITLVNRRLDSGSSDEAQRALSIADRMQAPAADQLLLRLLVPPRDPDPATPQAVPGARPHLLRGRPVPAPGTFMLTCVGLRGGSKTDWQERIVQDALHGLIVEDARIDAAMGWASWLCLSAVDAGLPRWGEQLRDMLPGFAGVAADAEARPLVRVDIEWAVTMLALAARAKTLPGLLALPGLADDMLAVAIAARLRLPAQDKTAVALAEAIRHARPKHGALPPDVLAKVHIALLLLRLLPADFPYEGADADSYDRTLVVVLQGQAASDLRDVLWRLILDGLLHDRHGWEMTPGIQRILLGLPPGRHLADYVARPAVTEKLVPYEELDPIWKPLVDFRPELRGPAASPQLREARRRTVEDPAEALSHILTRDAASGRPGVSGTVLAHAIRDALEAGMTPRLILGVLGNVPASGPSLTRCLRPKDLGRILRELPNIVKAQPALENWGTAAGSERVLFEFQELIFDGFLGQEYGLEFRRAEIGQLAAELGIRSRRLETLKEWVPRSNERPAPAAFEVNSLPQAHGTGRPGSVPLAAGDAQSGHPSRDFPDRSRDPFPQASPSGVSPTALPVGPRALPAAQVQRVTPSAIPGTVPAGQAQPTSPSPGMVQPAAEPRHAKPGGPPRRFWRKGGRDGQREGQGRQGPQGPVTEEGKSR